MKTIDPKYSLRRPSNQVIESKSKWLVGSSSNSTSGWVTRACASATRFLVPPESVPMIWSLCKCKRFRISDTRCSQFQPWLASSCDCNWSKRSWLASFQSACASVSYSVRRYLIFAIPSEAASKMVFFESKIGSWATYAMRSPCWICKRPSSSFSIPAKILRRDDFPVPFRPMRPTRSPSSRARLVWSNNGWWPNASLALVSAISAITHHYQRFNESEHLIMVVFLRYIY